MFKLLNRQFDVIKKRIREDFVFGPGVRNKSGQVAIVIILIIAVGLIFYAATMNMGQLSQLKTTVTISANTGASMLASLMSSYGQQVFETQLDGQDKICGYTGVFSAVLTIIAAVIAIVIIIASGGTGTAAAYAMFFAVVALVAAVGVLALQITYIQPKIEAAFAKIIAAGLSQNNQFLESGLTAGIGVAIQDPGAVADLYDLDNDGEFGFDGGEPRDKVSRYQTYYNERLKEIQPRDPQEFDFFFSKLRNFVYFESDGWALYDPPVCPDPTNPCCYDPADTTKKIPSQCNPCCIPLGEDDDNSNSVLFTGLRPACCDCYNLPGDHPNKCNDISMQCGVSTSCQEQSPYGDSYDSHWYQFVFRPFYDDPTNSSLSFRETLGLDDETDKYMNDPDNNPSQFPHELWTNPTLAANDREFRIEDTLGYYSSKVNTKSPEDAEAFSRCLDNCSNRNCIVETDPTYPGGLLPDPASSSLGYSYAAAYSFDEDVDCLSGNWNKYNLWHRSVYNNLLKTGYDPRGGLFSMFYKLADWGVNLEESSPPASMLSPGWTDELCYWRDYEYDGDCYDNVAMTGVELPPELSNNGDVKDTALNLTNDPYPLAPDPYDPSTIFLIILIG